MNYDEEQAVQFSNQTELGQLLLELDKLLKEIKAMLNPATDTWPLAHGRTGVIFIPSIPPSTACVLEHPDSGHWMLQVPCGGIFVADLGPTIHK
jgi:hypothetical protein